MLSCLTIFTLAALHCATAFVCPSGFDLIRNGQCHKEIMDAESVDAHSGASMIANACAVLSSSKPVIILNQEDNDFWVSVARENRKNGTAHGNILLGLECTNDRRWKWSDGSDVYFKPEGYDQHLDSECEPSHDAWSWSCMWAVDPKTGNWHEYCGDKFFMDLYCVYTPKPISDSDYDCSEFTYDNSNDMCYQLAKVATNWYEANTVCRSFGANAASIHNEEDNAFIRRLAVSKGLVKGLMLGGQGSSKKSMKWSDGTKWDYDNFAPDFPLPGLGDCLIMDTASAKGQWKNVNCNAEYPVACARPREAVLPTCDGALHTEGDILYSPGFPFSASEPCDFLLKVDPGMLVEVEILFLEANECCDHLLLFEGPLGTNEIVELSGELQAGLKFRTTSQNVMRASWQPNGGVNVRGMMITFRAVPK